MLKSVLIRLGADVVVVIASVGLVTTADIIFTVEGFLVTCFGPFVAIVVSTTSLL